MSNATQTSNPRHNVPTMQHVWLQKETSCLSSADHQRATTVHLSIALFIAFLSSALPAPNVSVVWKCISWFTCVCHTGKAPAIIHCPSYAKQAAWKPQWVIPYCRRLSISLISLSLSSRPCYRLTGYELCAQTNKHKCRKIYLQALWSLHLPTY